MPRMKKASETPAKPEAVAQTIAEPAPVLPPPPSPAVLALQSSIVEMIGLRAEIRKAVSFAQSELYAAQARLQAATGELQQLEQEVQYRMGVIAQLENRQPNNVVTITGQAYPLASLAGISSEPTQQMVADKMRAEDDLINRGHATRAML